MLSVGLGAGHAQAADNAVTVYGAYRSGGSFTDANTDKSLSIDDSGAGAVSLDLGLDGGRQLQLFLSRQSSQLPLAPAGTPSPAGSPPPSDLPMKVTYLHIGGTNFFNGPIGQGPYVVGGLGVTLFQPGLDEYANELRPSMNIGLGYQLPLGEHAALRFEARGYLTLVNSSGGLFCSGGCIVAIKGDAVGQGEVQLGLSVRF